MSASIQSFTHVRPAGPISRLVAALGAWRRERRARLEAQRVHRAAYDQIVHELSGCTDRQLLDIGISRLSIHDIAREHADMVSPLRRDR